MIWLVPLLRTSLLPVFLLIALSGASLPADEPAGPADSISSIAETSPSLHHAHHVEYVLSLPPDYITSVEAPDENQSLRALEHTNDPNARYFHTCPNRHSSNGCLLISPYLRERYSPGGRLEREKMIMMLLARRGREVEPAGLIHLSEGDPLGVWDWVTELSTETKESLQRQRGLERFRFPVIPDAR